MCTRKELNFIILFVSSRKYKIRSMSYEIYVCSKTNFVLSLRPCDIIMSELILLCNRDTKDNLVKLKYKRITVSHIRLLVVTHYINLFVFTQ